MMPMSIWTIFWVIVPLRIDMPEDMLKPIEIQLSNGIAFCIWIWCHNWCYIIASNETKPYKHIKRTSAINIFGFLLYSTIELNITIYVRYIYLRSKLHMANELFRQPQIWMFPIWWQTSVHVLPCSALRLNLEMKMKK